MLGFIDHFKVHFSNHFNTEIRFVYLKKFFILFFILLFYFLFASWHFGLKDGFLVMLLTWSFFVLGTPIPDGGIILDLPIKFFFNLDMVYSELIVWFVAISLNIFNLIFNISIYDKTFLLSVFKIILLNPMPYWIVIFLSMSGTFLSLYIGDEIYDVIKKTHSLRHLNHKNKLEIIGIVSLVVFVVIIYDILLRHLGITLF